MVRTQLLFVALLAACHGGEQAAAVPNAPPNAPVTDSTYTPAAMAVRFRARVAEHPTTLGGGAATSVDTLLARYVHGIETRDTVVLAPLALTVSEFAWLYYLDSPMAQSPYELDPDMMWTQISAQSGRGLTRALQKYGGTSFGAWRSTCTPPRTAGALRLHDCTIAMSASTLRLTVVERDGRFKLVGFGTNL